MARLPAAESARIGHRALFEIPLETHNPSRSLTCIKFSFAPGRHWITMFSRRRFLQSSFLAVGASAAGCTHISPSAKAVHARAGQKPRRIIHLVADGVSNGTLTCADHFSHLRRGRGLTWLQLYNDPAIASGVMDMRSLNSLVTDSSAASSSWGSGTRIINGMVNQSGDGKPLTTLYELFAQRGWQRGLVTTTEVTHATPAGFAACTHDREKATTIAAQYLKQDIEVLLGGGRKHFEAANRRDKRDLRAEFRSAGYAVLDSLSDLDSAPTDRRWLGTFARSHLPFDIDRPNDPKSCGVPSLAAMTCAALRKLERESHFILQVEGGRTDHAAHNSDAVTALHEMLSFDEALDVCLGFQQRHPDTLLVVTTDHGNGNIALNGTGDAYGPSLWSFQKVTNVKASFPEILRQLKKEEPVSPEKDTEKDPAAEKAKKEARTKAEKGADKQREAAEKKRKEDAVASPEEIARILRELTGYKVSTRRAGLLRPFLIHKGDALYQMMNSEMCALGQIMANYHALGFTGNAHTSDYVPILALGPGAEKFRGFIKNTDVFYNYLALADIDFRNPQEPLITGRMISSVSREDTESYKLG